jgi:hypothetical protein
VRKDARGAVDYAAVHSWLEGHLDGEGCDADCRSRPPVAGRGVG